MNYNNYGGQLRTPKLSLDGGQLCTLKLSLGGGSARHPQTVTRWGVSSAPQAATRWGGAPHLYRHCKYFCTFFSGAASFMLPEGVTFGPHSNNWLSSPGTLLTIWAGGQGPLTDSCRHREPPGSLPQPGGHPQDTCKYKSVHLALVDIQQVLVFKN